MVFQRPYKSHGTPEKSWGPKLVETAGYIPAKRQIENLINAGLRLSQSRKELYDFPDGDVPEDAIPDPTRNGNFDLADASQISQQILSRGVVKDGSSDVPIDSKIGTNDLEPNSSVQEE